MAVIRAMAFALAGSGLGSVASANFFITGSVTNAGTSDIVELYFHNDGVGGTGTALEAYQADYSGTPIQFRYVPGVDGEPGEVDIFNRPNNPALSWFRVHPNRQFISYADPTASSTVWAAPITNFRIVYATFELTPLPANTPAGVRFARLVLPDGGQFSLQTRVGGEVGPAVDATFTLLNANVAPVISGGGSLSYDIGNTALQTRRVSAVDPDGQLLSFTVTQLANLEAAGFLIAPAGAGAYDISFTPAQLGIGVTRFSLSATDSSIQSNNTSAALLTISVVPEPTTAAMLAGVFIARRRRA